MKVQFTPDDLEAIRSVIREEFANMKQTEKLYTMDELLEELGISRATYHRQKKLGKLNVERVGNKYKIKTYL